MPPEQDPVLVGARDREEAEDHRDDEDVVHGQRLLDDEAGQVFLRPLRADRPPHPGAEQEAERDVEGGQRHALADADFLLGIAVQDAEIEGEQETDDGMEGEPHPDGLAEEIRKQGGRDKFHRILRCGRAGRAQGRIRHRGETAARGARIRTGEAVASRS
jgi:hypothetical protein